THGSIMLVDGVENKDDNDGGTMMSYSLEGVQEFKFLAHNFSAQYGKASTGIMVMTTKSGANQVHGSAFAYGRSDAMTRVDYFSDPAHGGLGKPPYSRAQYGGSIGGPLIKDRLFFFGAAERTQQEYSQPVPATVYNQAVILTQALPAIDALPSYNFHQAWRSL